MNTVLYEHCSMFGTYNIPCKVKRKVGNKYIIEYFDPQCEETVIGPVNKNKLTFPKFADMVI